MSRMRSFSFSRLRSSKFSDEATMAALDSSHSFAPAHSRESSDGSITSSPNTSTFSARGHSRWPSSTSSLVTNPDSPAAAPAPKPTLDDLVEHPCERDGSSFESSRDAHDEPLCICDSPFCHHRQYGVAQTAYPTPDEWTPDDDYFGDGELSRERDNERRRSAQMGTESFTSRLSRHFSSFSKRNHGHRSSSSMSVIHLRSAPPSRTSSLRLSSTRSIAAPAASDFRNTIVTPPFSPASTEPNERSRSPPRARASSRATSRPVDIVVPLPEDEAEDREQLASTPLLPPKMSQYFNDSNEAVQSPLQSPTIAAPSIAASLANTPAGTPTVPSYQTPPLSAKASQTSLRNNRSGPMHHSDIPPLAIAEESDAWANRLGHANFHITPEPYMPNVCDAQTCKQLAIDWEAARVAYMRLAARTGEHYGITSQTYRLTQEKWAEIDAMWRANHVLANAEANASGDSPAFFQPLAETEQIAKLPSLNDPEQPSKFPEVEEKDIVGPMVRYAKIQHERQHSRKPSFLKVFTDPASLLGGRSSFSTRR